MKNITRAIAALSLATASLLGAQPAGADSTSRGLHRGEPGVHQLRNLSSLFFALDTDKDGVISAAEMANAAVSLTAFDDNGDGDISRAELRAAFATDAAPQSANTSGRSHRSLGITPVMLALDANNDGELSAAEIANAFASLATLDTNRDGKLSRDELRPMALVAVK
ncbi:MAG: hypothetical protein ABIQ12_00895 [Opitutaceae bacterium]